VAASAVQEPSQSDPRWGMLGGQAVRRILMLEDRLARLEQGPQMDSPAETDSPTWGLQQQLQRIEARLESLEEEQETLHQRLSALRGRLVSLEAPAPSAKQRPLQERIVRAEKRLRKLWDQRAEESRAGAQEPTASAADRSATVATPRPAEDTSPPLCRTVLEEARWESAQRQAKAAGYLVT
jgi:hypothetical protein